MEYGSQGMRTGPSRSVKGGYHRNPLCVLRPEKQSPRSWSPASLVTETLPCHPNVVQFSVSRDTYA